MSSGKHEVLSSTERNMKNRVMELEIENSRLQRLVAELLLKNQRLRDVQRSDSLLDGAVDLCRPL